MLRIDSNQRQIPAADPRARTIVLSRNRPAFAAVVGAVEPAGLERGNRGDQGLRSARRDRQVRLHDVVRQAFR